MPTNSEALVREYFRTIYKGPTLYNYRPDWLKYETGNNLELDLWFPELNVAVESDSFYHKLPDQWKRDRFKDARCKELGITLIRVANPKALLSRGLRSMVKTIFGTDTISYPFRQRLVNYKPIKTANGGRLMKKVKLLSRDRSWNKLHEREAQAALARRKAKGLI